MALDYSFLTQDEEAEGLDYSFLEQEEPEVTEPLAAEPIAEPTPEPEITAEAPEPTPITEPRRIEQQTLATQGEFAEQPGAPLNQQPDYLVKQAIGRQPEDTWADILTKDVKRIPERMKQLGGALVDMAGPAIDPLFQIDREDPGITRQVSQAVWEKADKEIKKLQPFVKEGSAKYYSSAIFNATADMGISVTAGMLSRNANVGLAIMTGQVFVDKKAQSINEGKEDWRANLDATFYAATEGLTEKIPLGILTKEGGKWLNRTLKSMGAEGLQEVFAEAMQIGYERKIWNEGEELSFGEVARRLWDAGVIGAGVGGTLAVVTSPVHAMRKDKAPDTDQSNVPPELFTPTHKAGGGQDVQIVTKKGKVVPDTYITQDGDIIRDTNAVPNAPDSNDVSMDINAVAESIKSEVFGEEAGVPEVTPDIVDQAKPLEAPTEVAQLETTLEDEKRETSQVVDEVSPVTPSLVEVAPEQIEADRRLTGVHGRVEERRIDIDHRRELAEMSEEEKHAEIEKLRSDRVTSKVAGIPNDVAYEENERLPHQAFMDVDDFKNVNARMTYEGADLALAEVGKVMKEEAGELNLPYHLHGDEFISESNDKLALESFNKRVQERLNNAVIEFELPDGTILTEKGIGVSYGIAGTKEAAEANLTKDKAARKAAGLREGVRREPDDVLTTVTERQQDQVDQVAVEEAAPKRLEPIGKEKVAKKAERAAEVVEPVETKPSEPKAEKKEEIKLSPTEKLLSKFYSPKEITEFRQEANKLSDSKALEFYEKKYDEGKQQADKTAKPKKLEPVSKKVEPKVEIKPTEPKPEAPTEPQDPYRAMAGKEISYEVEVIETGEMYTVTADAGVIMKGLDTREEALKKLRECI